MSLDTIITQNLMHVLLKPVLTIFISYHILGFFRLRNKKQRRRRLAVPRDVNNITDDLELLHPHSAEGRDPMLILK
jgi:hypothetical protein